MAGSNRSDIHESLSDDALRPLKDYKYSSVDKSPISYYILRHYWNGFVELLPLWLAPNMVTLLGFCFILANVALLSLVMPDLTGPGPSWLYFSFAFGLWMYSTMDNVDGKQARRTGTSSGLGELFDLLETAAMGLGSTQLGAFTALIPTLPMFFSTWETFHTHTLYLGYFNGPTEGLIMACALMIVSGVYGPEVWHAPLQEAISLPGPLAWIGAYSVIDFWVPLILFAFLVAHLPGCVLNVVAARRRNNLPLEPVFWEWTPILTYTAATMLWLGSPHSTLLANNHLMLFCLTQSFVFGRMTTKIILAHLTRQPFPYWTVLMMPLIGGAILTNVPRLGVNILNARVELVYLYSYFVFAMVAYFRWAVVVINAICKFLGINCLTIPKDKQQMLMANGKIA